MLGVVSGAVVARAGTGLVESPPSRAGQVEAGRAGRVGDQFREVPTLRLHNVASKILQRAINGSYDHRSALQLVAMSQDSSYGCPYLPERPCNGAAMNIEITVDTEVFHLLKSKAEPFVDTPNSVLRRLLGLDAVDERSAPAAAPTGARAGRRTRRVQGDHRGCRAPAEGRSDTAGSGDAQLGGCPVAEPDPVCTPAFDRARADGQEHASRRLGDLGEGP